MEPGTGDSLKNITNEIQRLIDKEESGVLVLVIASTGSAPGKIGSKMLVLADGNIHGTIGGGVFEARVMADSLNALEDGHGPRSIHYNLEELGMSCGGQITVYIEPLQAPRRVVVFGGGHVGAAVARQCKLLGCVVTVVDERLEWANPERLPGVDSIANQTFAQYLETSPPGSKDHVVIVTRGHAHDQAVLEGCIQRRPAYLGMIGSRKKARLALNQLREKGVDEGLIKAVRSPMGLDIGAVTPEEIAVSLAAELVLFWRKGELPDSRTVEPAGRTRSAERSSRTARPKPPIREAPEASAAQEPPRPVGEPTGGGER
jgi:xanthine dehydrogenase accessory factor